MNVEYSDGGAIVSTPQVAFTYQTDDKVRDFDKYNKSTNRTLKWDNQNSFIGDYLLFPYGNENDLPSVIKDVVQNNYIAPGLLRKKTALLWGTGPLLYSESLENNKRVRKLSEDADVTAWLSGWDYEAYLLKACEDYQYIQGVFTRYEMRRGSSLGKPAFINELHHVEVDKARLAALRSANTKKASHVILNDWSFEGINSLHDYKVYSLFDFKNPFAKPNSILYSNLYSFCSDYYSVPEIYGSLEWLNRSTAVPLIFKAMSRNSINLKYHITSPETFWNKKREELQKNCGLASKTYNEQMLEDYKTMFLKKIAEVLAGDENSGKFLHTIQSLYVNGVNIIEFGWKIEVIDQKTKDLVESQIKISQRADHALSAGINLHSSLGNVSETGKSDSGSEQYYALISYLNTGVDIPEMIICKAINYAIKANFPSKNLKLGFHRDMPEKQQDISPKDRMHNNV